MVSVPAGRSGKGSESGWRSVWRLSTRRASRCSGDGSTALPLDPCDSIAVASALPARAGPSTPATTMPAPLPRRARLLTRPGNGGGYPSWPGSPSTVDNVPASCPRREMTKRTMKTPAAEDRGTGRPGAPTGPVRMRIEGRERPEPSAGPVLIGPTAVGTSMSRCCGATNRPNWWTRTKQTRHVTVASSTSRGAWSTRKGNSPYRRLSSGCLGRDGESAEDRRRALS